MGFIVSTPFLRGPIITVAAAAPTFLLSLLSTLLSTSPHFHDSPPKHLHFIFISRFFFFFFLFFFSVSLDFSSSAVLRGLFFFFFFGLTESSRI